MDFEKIGEDIFEGDMGQAIAVMWWIVYLAGGKITFPADEEFWLDNYPEDARLVLRHEDGKLVMCAEQLSWQSSTDA